MQTIAEFKPIHGFLTSTLIVCLFLALAALIFYFFNRQREVDYAEQNMRNLLSMFALFIAVAAIGFGGFELFLNQRLTVINLYSDGLDLPKGRIEFSNVKKVYLYKAPSSGMRSGQNVKSGDQILVVEQFGGKNHYFFEKDYEIKKMVKSISDQFEKYKRENEMKKN